MSGLIKTETITAIASGFLGRGEAVRNEVAKIIRDYPFAASAAIIAGQIAVEDAMTDEDKALIKAARGRGKVLIEGCSNLASVPDEKVFAIVAEATTLGLLFGTRQYSVWANGTIYIKEDGYRQLFKNRGDCSPPEVKADAPVWRQLGDKAGWYVTGSASVVINSQLMTWTGTVPIQANQSDGAPNVAAKGDRALLKKLWKQVSFVDLEEDSEGEVVLHAAAVTTKAIEQAPVETAQSYDGSIIRLRKMLHETPDKMTFVENVWTAITEATSEEQLAEAGNALAAMKKEYSEQVLSLIRPFFKSRQLALRSTQA
jgi:hypothetical protein